MRTTILLWSAFSGVVLGLLAGIVVGAVAVGIAYLLPARWDGLVERLRTPVLVVCFVVLLLAGAVLGWLEGRLKLS